MSSKELFELDWEVNKTSAAKIAAEARVLVGMIAVVLVWSVAHIMAQRFK